MNRFLFTILVDDKFESPPKRDTRNASFHCIPASPKLGRDWEVIDFSMHPPSYSPIFSLWISA